MSAFGMTPAGIARLWLSRQRQNRLQPAACPVAQQQVAAVHLCDVACNAQAQAAAAGIAAA